MSQPRKSDAAQDGSSGTNNAPVPEDTDEDPFPYQTSFENYTVIPNKTLTVVGDVRGPMLPTLEFVKSLVCRPANCCQEARKGQQFGSLKLDYNGYPAVPDKKFTSNDPYEEGEQWPVQSFYETKKKNQWQVLYEGWDSLSMNTCTMVACAEIDHCLRRSNFLQAIEPQLPAFRQSVHNHRFLCEAFVTNPQHTFWAFEDISYFHTKAQEEQRMAPVHYFCFSDPMKKPPMYHLVTKNVIEVDAMKLCIGKECNKRFAQLRKKNGWILQGQKSACENSTSCKCDERFYHLYSPRNTKNLRPQGDGRIEMRNIKWNDRKIIMECSNECGCSSKCPRRQLQRGQVKSLAVVYESESTGFGLKSMEQIEEGELIAEYAGLLYSSSQKTEAFMKAKDTSYEASFTVMDNDIIIDALHLGSVSRFANHHCNPNAIFIECDSRASTDEPLVPRIAVYAKQPIAVGEEVTICYYDVDKKYDKYSDIRCNCGAEKCIGLLPSA